MSCGTRSPIAPVWRLLVSGVSQLREEFPVCVHRDRSAKSRDQLSCWWHSGNVFPDYTIEFDEQHVATLDWESADDAMVLASVTLGRPPTANLLGPLVVNRRTRAAAQVVQVPVELPGGRTAGAAVRSLSVLQAAVKPGHGFGGVEAPWTLASWISR